MSRLTLRNGRVFDPAAGIDGHVRTLCIEHGRMVEPFADGDWGRVIDATGLVVMPGGVDIHCHIAGPAINRARRLLPEQAAADIEPARDKRRGGSGGIVPSTFTTGHRYAALGYTTAIEAAVSPTGSRQAHFELADTPNIDRGLLLLLANNERVLQAIADGEPALARDLAAVLLSRCGAYGIKAVNPGGVAHWKHGGDPKSVTSIHEPLDGLRLSPRAIIETLADAVDELHLPHALHLHCNRLGLPGNIETTLETLRVLEGRRHHLTHIQFHAYADDGTGGFADGSARLIEWINAHPETTCDVGQVMFGPALTITEDSPVEHLLWQLTGNRWVNMDVETHSGCGMLPIEFRNKGFLHSLQWAIGLELFLGTLDPWRVALSTDHPNGGSFLVYPRLIATLMDREFRARETARADAKAIERTRLRDFTREYTLSEIAIITRAGPARILGLKHKGTLAVGADADITVYSDDTDRLRMFETPRFVIKDGQVIVEDAELRAAVPGVTFRCEPPVERSADRVAHEWAKDVGGVPLHQLGPTVGHR